MHLLEDYLSYDAAGHYAHGIAVFVLVLFLVLPGKLASGWASLLMQL